MDLMSLLNEVLQFAQKFGSMQSPEKVAGILMLVLSIWKSSFARPLWDKLGGYQVLVAPVIGLVLAFYQLPGGATIATIWAGIQSGLLAVAFHHVLDAVKALPKIGPKYVQWIEFVDQLLFRPKAEQK